MSLDRCVQTTLSALYPPSQATSPTVLFQVFGVVDSRFRGDGLRYLLHFLLPAKQILQKLQQEARLQYCGLLFLHEGWPLCLHEKIVVQLCPLDRRFLRPGDFYLLVSPDTSAPQAASAPCRPNKASSPCLLLCSLSAGRHHVEQQEVSEVAHRCLFSMAWLDSVNKERQQRGATRLQRCLLSTSADVFRVPWEDLVYPQFISRPLNSLKDDKEAPVNNRYDQHCSTDSSQQDMKLPPLKSERPTSSTEDEDSEGEYVELSEIPLPRFSPQKGSLTQSISLQLRARTITTAHANTQSVVSTDTPPPRPGGDARSHFKLCSRHIEPNLNQGSSGPVILTPITPSVSPRAVGSSSSQSQRQTSQEHRKGTTSTSNLRLNTEPEKCIEVKQGEAEVTEGQIHKHDMSGGEGAEKVQPESGCRRDKDVPQHVDQEDKGQESEGGEEEEEGTEEVEVEEEVQVIMQQSPERMEEKVMNETRGGEMQVGDATSHSTSITLQTHADRNAAETFSTGERSESGESEDTHCEDSRHCERDKRSEDSYCENDTVRERDVRILSVPTKAREPGSLWTEPHKSEIGDIKQKDDDEEEEKEESSCEVGAGGTAELYTEGTSIEPHPTRRTGRPQPEPPFASSRLIQSTSPSGPLQMSQCPESFYTALLSSGAVCLPGTRDRSGRALLTVCCTSSVWTHLECESAELLRLLLYYTSTLRDEVRALGLTVLVDARRSSPVPALFSVLRSLQENTPGSIHTVLLLVNKDSSLRLDKPPQVEALSSLKAVQKHVELCQLPSDLGGSLCFSQSSWLCFRRRLEQLRSRCEDAVELLQKTIDILQSTPPPAAAQDAERLLSRYETVMRSILEDDRLVRLQQEGGASLSRLRVVGVTEENRLEVEAVTLLYEQVDELLHRLVTLSNCRTQQLNFILHFKSLQQDFSEVMSWLDEVGDVHLKTLEEPADSLELVRRKQQEFRQFFTAAHAQCERGEALLARLQGWDEASSTDPHIYQVKVHSFWARLQDFSQRVRSTGRDIERAVELYGFLDQAYGWALGGMRQLAGVSMEDCTLPDKCSAVIGCLQDYRQQHPPIPEARFQEMKVVAGELRGEHGLRQWSFAWSKCQETKKMFDRKMEAVLRTRDSTHRRRSDSALSRSSTSSRKSLLGLWGVHKTSSSFSCPSDEDIDTSSPPTPQHTPLLHRLFRSVSSDETSDLVGSSSSSPGLHLQAPTFTSGRRPQLRKTQSFECPPTPEGLRSGPCPRALSEPVRTGNTGVFIRGLEVSSTEAADHTLCPRTGAQSWAGHRPHGPGTPSTPRVSSAADPRPRRSKLRHIVEELVNTEREYVRSLRYIIHHYFPEMDRVDVPQDLRGKRSVVFGNLEKLLDFHSQFFLRELEACWKHPLRVPRCFLRHQEQFALYALYSKNKPKSDALLMNHGNSFFRRKQVELGDKMDLSSYLLKPIQRMSKYALLLMDLMKEVTEAQEAEQVALHAATNMVKFQLRHGNDLLAMDAIQDCDVNLKEQGQLIRQDEFTVWSGRRKCLRHIFLFEELILFSKPKKMEGGLDVFTYKLSFKTADVGLTESTGANGLRFEIWFRRRTSRNQTFILQAATEDVKNAWTSDVAQILWTQATRNKEMRLKEMVSMGVGNKPFLDIQPSDAAISDRAVHYIMKSRGARTRASIAVSVFDHSHPFKRGAVTSDPTAPGPASSGLLGPLDLHLYSRTLNAPAETFIGSCTEEEQETSSQPSMTTESSGSSSHRLSGSTGSDSGCVSSHQQEALQEESSLCVSAKPATIV